MSPTDAVLQRSLASLSLIKLIVIALEFYNSWGKQQAHTIAGNTSLQLSLLGTGSIKEALLASPLNSNRIIAKQAVDSQGRLLTEGKLIDCGTSGIPLLPVLAKTLLVSTSHSL